MSTQHSENEPESMTTAQGQQWLKAIGDIARQAGGLIMSLYDDREFETYAKADDSPVTSADLAANELLLKALHKLTPTIPVLSEESGHVQFGERQHWPRYWLIDPIDGTQEFIARSGDFAVNIALVEHNEPVLGVIYWPSGDVLYAAQKGQGATKEDATGQQPIHVNQLTDPAQDPITIAISRRQPHERVTQRMSSERVFLTLPAGSCSLKACFIAEGKADCFLRVGPTGEWDTAAAHVIVHEAGGSILSENFEPLTYNRTADRGNPNFLILGDSAVNWREIFLTHRQDN